MKSRGLRKGYAWRAFVSTVVAAVIGVGLAIATQAWLPGVVTLIIAVAPMAAGGVWFSRWQTKTEPRVDSDYPPRLHQPRRSETGTIDVKRTLPKIRDWFMGNTARQKRSAERAYAHPFVYSVILGSFWGLFTGLVLNRTFSGIAYWFVLGNLVFGPWAVWQSRSRHQRRIDGQE